ncbi:MazG nucleotide pyrophosphohydrolase domain-containing protein [Halococcus agarilyticus]|uniref:MazG nucleotide pyrophosphohydrolase domain-containing protein n=1 Tax=Halococcus agarilyticus TaxID=1232219 RepID=UPI000677DB9B|nr:MazG nucleotide pyrophosphohydrolase domain-containing protein [Halococcus agarilyticus]
MEEQQKVAEFVDEHGLDMSTEYRLLNLVEEVGEIAEDAIESAEYGDSPGEITVTEDEFGDVLFTALQMGNSAGIDASEALDSSLAKYEERIDESGSPTS